MRYRLLRGAAALAGAGLAVHPPAALAHGIAGDRVFPATLTIDDPAVGDELSVPTFAFSPGDGGSDEKDYGFEWDKTIFTGFGFAFNDGYSRVHQPARAGGNNYGWDDPVLTLKWQIFENDEHEAMASVGLQKEFGGVGAVGHGLADASGWTQPTLYVGKGLGDLPSSLDLLRPLAITGELGYQWADEPSQTGPGGFAGQNPDFWNIGFSVQYNLEYLHADVKDYGWGEFVNSLIPLVEVSYSTPASASHAGATTTGTVAPGILYEHGRSYQIGIEALIPVNKASGNGVGVIAQLHFYLDDLLPDSLGKPVF